MVCNAHNELIFIILNFNIVVVDDVRRLETCANTCCEWLLPRQSHIKVQN